jgi:hypothetical protein
MTLICDVSLRGAPLTWFPGPSLEMPLSRSAAAYTGGLNYLTGGDDSFGYFDSTTYPMSLAATNGYWSLLSPYYGVNLAPGAVVYDGNLIIYGGTDGTNAQNSTIAYNLSGDTPPIMPAMNTARAYLGYAPDRSGSAYAFGGLDTNGNALATAEKLDFNNNALAWAPIASLPVPLYNFSAAFDRTNYIYTFGGQADPSTGVETSAVYRYSVSGNSWSTMTPLPVAVAGSSAALASDGNLYVIGGTSGGVATNLVQVYSPASNSWAISTPLPAPVTLGNAGVDSLGRLLVMGGQDTNGLDLPTVWRSQPFGVPDSAPVFTNFPANAAVYEAAFSASIGASGNPPPVYQLLSGPAGMNVDYYSGAISWTPQLLSQIGSNSVTIAATNYAGATNYTFNIYVPNTPPLLPANFTVTNVTDVSATVLWNPQPASAGSVTYSLAIPHPYHSPKGSGGGVNYQVIASGITTNAMTVGGINPGSVGTFALSAVGPGGATGFSYGSWFSVTTTSPQAPTNVWLTELTSTSVSLAWAPSPGPTQNPLYSTVTSYAIMEHTLSAPVANLATVTNLPGTNGTVTGLVPGQGHLWYVAGVDDQGVYSAFTGLPFTYVTASNPMPQPATLSLTQSMPANNGDFQFTVQPAAASTTYVQATTNLNDPNAWITIATNPVNGHAFIFTDPAAFQVPYRFYRVISP